MKPRLALKRWMYNTSARLRGAEARVPSGVRSWLHSLSGKALADAATRVARMPGGSSPRFYYIEAGGFYVARDTREHYLTHSHRVHNLIYGTRRRGRQMFEEYLLADIPFEAGDAIVDVGANTGDLSLALETTGLPFHLTCFEPSPREFAALEKNLANDPLLASHRTHQLALWYDDQQSLQFHVKSATADSSVIPIEGYDEIIEVGSGRLDRILDDRSYRLLKLEAEGAEPEVLQGAEGILHRFQFISADVGPERGVEQMRTDTQVEAFLKDRGFVVRRRGSPRETMLFENTNWTSTCG